MKKEKEGKEGTQEREKAWELRKSIRSLDITGKFYSGRNSDPPDRDLSITGKITQWH